MLFYMLFLIFPQNDQDTRVTSVHKNGCLIETFVSKNSNIHPSQPQVTQLNSPISGYVTTMKACSTCFILAFHRTQINLNSTETR